MNPDHFGHSRAGRLVKMPRGYWAFVPHLLPPHLAFDSALVQAVSTADRALGELAGVGNMLPNPHLLIGPFLRREAVLSSRIEGTQASLADVFAYEAAQLPLPNGGRRSSVPDVREVHNYVVALEYGLKRLSTLPLSLRLIREVHEQLTQGVRGTHQTPGEFRRSQNWIGPPGCLLNDAVYVPPPAHEMDQALDAFERFLHGPPTFPPLVWLALTHYQFEAIHPFLDGNGRVGRLLITLLLCEREWLPQPLLYLSAYFERHRQPYYDHLLAVSQNGAWKEWVLFFLQGVSVQARDAVRRSRRLLDLHQQYRDGLQRAGSSARALQLVDHLVARPVLTIPRAQQLLGVTYRSAQLNVEKLVRAGILHEATGQRRNRVYVASGVLGILDEAFEEEDTGESSRGAINRAPTRAAAGAGQNQSP